MNALRLPDSVYSPDQISAAILELNNYRGVLTDAATRVRTGSKRLPLSEPGALLGAIAEASGWQLTDVATLDTARKQLELMLSKAPVVHLTLAAVPNLTIKRQLTAWLRENISPEVLVTFSARSDLGGGVVVQAGSRIYDFSFKRLLAANKGRIAEITAGV